jgi:hypothetical protein
MRQLAPEASWTFTVAVSGLKGKTYAFYYPATPAA